MTGQERESQLSAMFDGELSAEECELLARRLSRDENLRRSYAHYALIGSVIRNEPLASRTLAGKVHAALRGTAPLALAVAEVAPSNDAPAAAQRSASRWVWPLGAVGLAASVAAIALLSLEPAIIQGPTPAPALASAPPSSAAVLEEVITGSVTDPRRAQDAFVAEVVIPARPVTGEPESYVTPPVEGLADRRLAPIVQLANYVVAHGSVSGPIMRHSALSAFITDQPEGADESSAEEAVAP